VKIIASFCPLHNHVLISNSNIPTPPSTQIGHRVAVKGPLCLFVFVHTFPPNKHQIFAIKLVSEEAGQPGLEKAGQRVFRWTERRPLACPSLWFAVGSVSINRKCTQRDSQMQTNRFTNAHRFPRIRPRTLAPALRGAVDI